MRKGTVFVFTGEYPSDYFLHYLANEFPREINKKIIKESRYIRINGYDIRLMKYPNERLRGYRPEFIYYIGNTLNHNDVINCYKAEKQIEMDTKILSTRKRPIKYINVEQEIDLREFIDDDYALLKCLFKKLNWKDKFGYVWLKVRNKLRKELK